MSSTTIDYTADIAATSGDFPKQRVKLSFTSGEVVLFCDGTVVRGRVSRGDPSPRLHFTPELHEALFGTTSLLSPVSRGHVLHGIGERFAPSA